MANKYYLCKAGARLRNEMNASNPQRDKRSDGWIGDDSHAARKSDHNPDYTHGGIVLAVDIDNNGINPDRLVSILIKDRRVHYVIWNGHIWSVEHDFKKRVYNGSSKHTEHIHVSFMLEYANDGRPFGYYPRAATHVSARKPTPSRPAHKTNSQIADEVIAGKWGSGKDRQHRLTDAGYDYTTIQTIVNKRSR